MAITLNKKMNRMRINEVQIGDCIVTGILQGNFSGDVKSGCTVAGLERVQSQTFEITVDDTHNDDSANYSIPAGSIVKAVKLTPSGFTGADDSYNAVITDGTAGRDDSLNKAAWDADGTCDSRNVYMEITAFARTNMSWVKITKGTATTAAVTKKVKVEIIFSTYFGA